MKLATKLLIAPVVATTVAVTAIGINAALNAHQSTVIQRWSVAEAESGKAVDSTLAQLGALHARAYRTMSIVDSLDEAQLKAFGKEAGEQLAGMRKTMGQVVASAPPGSTMARTWQALAPQLDIYLKQFTKALEMASVERAMGTASMNAAEKTFGGISVGMREVADQLDLAQRAAMAELAAEQFRITLGVAGIGLLAAIGSLLWARRMLRGVAADLNQAVELTRDVSGGNLARAVQVTRQDELGELMRSLDGMTGELRQTVQTVKVSAANINSASAEIASGNNDLSRRTEQAASSLQQTAGAMTQLNTTVRQSADAAAQANQLASSAAAVAQRGGNVVAEVVTTMDEIQTRSRKISDIIGTIDGIAFQTNILALNAAVEAARAGEQGRGFAVVAGEVRNLAGRSAEAAREIKSLIAASVEKVESGSRLVKDAGSTMGEIVASVQRVNDIMGEISAAANEQRADIERVAQAVSELDQMTQQNAALVEQSAAAAESLKQQASTLDEVMAGFRVGDEAGAPGVAPTPVAAQPKAQVTGHAPTPASTAPQVAARPVARAAKGPAPSVDAATEAVAATADAGDDWQSF